MKILYGILLFLGLLIGAVVFTCWYESKPLLPKFTKAEVTSDEYNGWKEETISRIVATDYNYRLSLDKPKVLQSHWANDGVVEMQEVIVNGVRDIESRWRTPTQEEEENHKKLEEHLSNYKKTEKFRAEMSKLTKEKEDRKFYSNSENQRAKERLDVKKTMASLDN
jgi:hypothetical protein